MAETIDRRPAEVQMQAYRGDDYNQTVTVDNGTTNYALTTAKMQIRTLGGTAAVTLTVGAGITITNPGSIALNIPKATMATLEGEYRYDLQVVLTASGEERTIIAGLFIVSADTTQ